MLALTVQAAFAQDLVVKDTNGKWGIKSPYSKQMLVEGRYETKEELLSHKLMPGQFGYYNKKGELILGGNSVPELKGAWSGNGDFFEDRAVVVCKGRYAYIDTKEKLITGFTFSYAGDFKDGKARVTDYNTRESYYIDRKGKRIQEEVKGENIKSFDFYVKNGIYKSKKVKYKGETKYRYGSLGWGVDNKYADGKGVGEIEGVGTYDGEWSDNVPHGKGTMRLINGETFKGDFVNGTPQGQGTYYSNQGTQTGDFANGQKVEKKPDGNGPSDMNYLALQGGATTTYQSGKYEGQMVNGVENGLGRFVYNNGAMYEGQWKDGLPNGNGKMVLKNGTTYDGAFAKGYFTNGKIFKYLRDVQEKEVIPYGNGLMAYVKGWKKVTKTRRVMGSEVSETVDGREISTEIALSADLFVEVLGWRDDNLWYGGFVEKQALASAGKTEEKTSTYGYHDSKNSANVVVNTTTKTDVPATYKTVRVPCEGCDADGYKTRLPIDRSKFSDNYHILPHEMVLDKNRGALAPVYEAVAAAEAASADAKKFVMPVPPSNMVARKLKFKQTNFYQYKVEYSGEVKYEMANGYGEAIISQVGKKASERSPEKYKGYWKSNLQQGKGVMELNYGNGKEDKYYEYKYEGDFVNGKFNGKGIYTTRTSTYTGDWKNGKKEGKGVYTSDNYTYAGDFREDHETGYGKKTYKDGKIEEGYFVIGQFKGTRP